MKLTIIIFVVLVSLVNVKARRHRKCSDPKRCATLCKLQKAGKMDKNAEVILRRFFEKNKRQAATECADKNEQEDICERADLFHSCFHRALANITLVDNSNKCANETNTVADADKAKQASVKFDDKKACYHRCMLIKANKFNEENEVNFWKFGAQPYKYAVSKVCYEANNQEDTCLQAIRRVTCVMKEVKEKRKEARMEAAMEAKAAKTAKEAKEKHDREAKEKHHTEAKDPKEAKSE